MERKDLIRGYATALFGVAEAEDAIDRVSDELFRVAKTIEQNYDLRSALTDIAIAPERKEDMLGELLGERVSPHTRNILGFVISQGRARELPHIVESLAQLAAEARSRVLAEVRSAVPLDEEQRRRLGEALTAATGKSVDVKVLVDPGVIGGLVAKVGDQIIDGTVRTKLAQLKEALEARA